MIIGTQVQIKGNLCTENEKKDKQCLLNTPRTVMGNKENYYREYKDHTKWLSCESLCQKYFFFGMTLLHAHAHYICIVCVKYQKASVKALVQVDFLMYALSKHKHNPYLLGNRKKKLSFCQKLLFWHQTSSQKCSLCLYCVSKVSDCLSKSCGTS